VQWCCDTDSTRPCQGANHQLWNALRRKIAVRRAPTSARWIKSHPTAAMVIKRKLEEADMIGNAAADKLADQGAREARVGPGDKVRHLHELAASRMIQKRLVAIHEFELQRRLPHEKVERPLLIASCLPALAFCSSHVLVSSSAAPAGLWCSRCNHVPDRAELLTWVRQPCHESVSCKLVLESLSRVVSSVEGLKVVVGGNQLHETHSLMVCKGVFFCRKCGYYSGVMPQKLVSPCSPGAGGPKSLKRLLDMQVPSGLANWPLAQPIGRRAISLA